MRQPEHESATGIPLPTKPQPLSIASSSKLSFEVLTFTFDLLVALEVRDTLLISPRLPVSLPLERLDKTIEEFRYSGSEACPTHFLASGRKTAAPPASATAMFTMADVASGEIATPNAASNAASPA
jgi:hypothetical protein